MRLCTAIHLVRCGTDADLDVDGLEWTVLPSGGHAVDHDVMYVAGLTQLLCSWA